LGQGRGWPFPASFDANRSKVMQKYHVPLAEFKTGRDIATTRFVFSLSNLPTYF
jgi:hypothetical protein